MQVKVTTGEKSQGIKGKQTGSKTNTGDKRNWPTEEKRLLTNMKTVTREQLRELKKLCSSKTHMKTTER